MCEMPVHFMLTRATLQVVTKASLIAALSASLTGFAEQEPSPVANVVVVVYQDGDLRALSTLRPVPNLLLRKLIEATN